MGKESGLMGNTFLGFLMFPDVSCHLPWNHSWVFSKTLGHLFGGTQVYRVFEKPFTPGLEAQLLVVNHSTLTIEEEIFDEGKQTDPRQ